MAGVRVGQCTRTVTACCALSQASGSSWSCTVVRVRVTATGVAAMGSFPFSVWAVRLSV